MPAKPKGAVTGAPGLVLPTGQTLVLTDLDDGSQHGYLDGVDLDNPGVQYLLAADVIRATDAKPKPEPKQEEPS